jgi:putative membrane protein
MSAAQRRQVRRTLYLSSADPARWNRRCIAALEEVLMRITTMITAGAIAALPAFSTARAQSYGDVKAPGAAAGAAQARLSATDREFVKTAAAANLAELKLAQLGVERGSTKDVRDLAQHMIDDHTAVGQELARIAQRENLPLASQPTAEQKMAYERLSKLQGAEFDRAFLDQLASDHQQAVMLYRNEAENGRDPDLKAFANNTLPSLRRHEQMISRDMQRRPM